MAGGEEGALESLQALALDSAGSSSVLLLSVEAPPRERGEWQGKKGRRCVRVQAYSDWR